jgi:hypothetical protein
LAIPLWSKRGEGNLDQFARALAQPWRPCRRHRDLAGYGNAVEATIDEKPLMIRPLTRPQRSMTSPCQRRDIAAGHLGAASTLLEPADFKKSRWRGGVGTRAFRVPMLRNSLQHPAETLPVAC